MIETRRAVTGDATELVRLRAVMLGAMAGQPVEPGPWQQEALALLRTRLAEPDPVMAAYVVEVPGGAGLAACAVGAIDLRLGGPGNPSGRTGYVYNVVTDEAYRRRGSRGRAWRRCWAGSPSAGCRRSICGPRPTVSRSTGRWGSRRSRIPRCDWPSGSGDLGRSPRRAWSDGGRAGNRRV
ncbi:hypothetical protein ACFQZ4_33635 [Catellatospora coxensis]